MTDNYVPGDTDNLEQGIQPEDDVGIIVSWDLLLSISPHA